MRKYCKKGEPIKSISWNGADKLNIRENKIYHSGDEEYEIFYCPMCGRKLEGKE